MQTNNAQQAVRHPSMNDNSSTLSTSKRSRFWTIALLALTWMLLAQPVMAEERLSIEPINARTVSVVVLVSTIVGRMLAVMIVVRIVAAMDETIAVTVIVTETAAIVAEMTEIGPRLVARPDRCRIAPGRLGVALATTVRTFSRRSTRPRLRSLCSSLVRKTRTKRRS